MNRRRVRWLALAAVTIAAVAGTTIPALAADEVGTVMGSFTDGSGPMVGASVGLIDGDYNYIAFAYTDDTGAFTLSDVPAGDYRLQFGAAGFIQWSYGKRTFETADTVTVTGGETTTVDEVVRSHGSITGHVVSADGTPAAGYEVTAASTDSDFPQYLYGYTDAEGAYRLPYVDQGGWKLSFRRGWDSPEQWADNQTSEAAARVFQVVTGEVLTVDQTILGSGALSGRVTDKGVPVEGVEVSVQHTDGSSSEWTQTDADGRYRVSLWPGTYTVSFRLPNGLTEYAPRQIDPLKAGTITVAAGADTVLNEKLRARGFVTGTLTDAAGDPVAEASASLIGKGWDHPSGYTDATGAYRIEAWPGTYRLQFSTTIGVQWSYHRSVPAEADPIAVTADQTLTIDESLAATGTAAVTAADSVTGNPITAFCLSMYNTVTEVVRECTTTGTVTAQLLPGTYSMSTYSEEGEWPYVHRTANPLVVVSGQSVAATMSLVRTATVSALVTDRDSGDPVQGACVELLDVMAPQWLGNGGQWCSDADGRVSVRQVRPGSYKAFVWISDGVHGRQWVGPNGGVGKFKRAQTITVTTGQELTIAPIRLDKAGSISGTITDEVTGQPIANASVGLSTFNAGAGNGGGGVPTDADGRYTLSDLGPYAWTLYLYGYTYAGEWSGDATYRDRAAGVAVTEGGTATYDASLGHGTTVVGRVTDVAGHRAGSARITFRNADTGDEMAAGDVYDNYRQYTVQVRGRQRVKLEYYGNVAVQYYDGYVGAADFASATTFSVPATGSKRINVVMTTPYLP